MTEPALRTDYRVVIIDDEPLAREGLRRAVLRLAGETALQSLTIVALCENGVQGVDAIRTHSADIALVDVVMPEIDGFAMIEQLEPEETPPAIIFVTAFDNRAVKAFEVQALDYLVKPASDDRLREALLRGVRRVDEVRALAQSLGRELTDNSMSPGAYLKQLVIPERGHTSVVPVGDIEWIEGDTYYVRVHSAGRARLLRERMQHLETVLDPAQFVRCHRSALVRLDLIREIRQESPFAFSALLANGMRVPVSRARRRALEQLLDRRQSSASTTRHS